MVKFLLNGVGFLFWKKNYKNYRGKDFNEVVEIFEYIEKKERMGFWFIVRNGNLEV